jgi:hypothetical protein
MPRCNLRRFSSTAVEAHDRPAPRPFLPRAQPTVVPSLIDVHADPRLLDDLPVTALLELQRQHLLIGVSLKIAITKCLVSQHASARTGPDRLVLIDEAATMLGTSTDSIHRKWKRLRLGFIDVIDGKWKITVRELEKYIGRRPRG